jgi:hypothetical protein
MWLNYKIPVFVHFLCMLYTVYMSFIQIRRAVYFCHFYRTCLLHPVLPAYYYLGDNKIRYFITSKVILVLITTTWRRVRGVVGIKLRAYGGEWLVARSGLFTLREEAQGAFWFGGFVGSRLVWWCLPWIEPLSFTTDLVSLFLTFNYYVLFHVVAKWVQIHNTFRVIP